MSCESNFYFRKHTLIAFQKTPFTHSFADFTVTLAVTPIISILTTTKITTIVTYCNNITRTSKCLESKNVKDINNLTQCMSVYSYNNHWNVTVYVEK